MLEFGARLKALKPAFSNTFSNIFAGFLMGFWEELTAKLNLLWAQTESSCYSLKTYCSG
jgi:hypothetical protein